MSNQQVTVRAPGGIGFPGALFIAFLVLKLTGVIGWSWWWVTAPLWVPAAIYGMVFFLSWLLVMAVALALHGRKKVPDTRPRKRYSRGRPR